MFTFFTVWFVLLILFVWGNKRWQDRMARMDAELEQAFSKSRIIVDDYDTPK
jgi:hypothetical protein